MGSFTFGEGDDNIKPERKRLSLELATVRIALPWLTAAGWDKDKVQFPEVVLDGTPPKPVFRGVKPQFVAGHFHYVDGVGPIEVTPEIAKYLGIEMPKIRIGTYAVVFRCNNKGAVGNSVIEEMGFEIVPWTFDEKKYAAIRLVHATKPLTEVDLMVTCTDTKYQKCNFAAGIDHTWARTLHMAQENPELMKFVRDELATMGETAMRAVLGRTISLRELKEKMDKKAEESGAPAPAAKTAATFSSPGAAASVLDE